MSSEELAVFNTNDWGECIDIIEKYWNDDYGTFDIEGKDNIRHVELGGLAISDAIKLNFADRLKYLKKVDLINSSLVIILPPLSKNVHTLGNSLCQ